MANNAILINDEKINSVSNIKTITKMKVYSQIINIGEIAKIFVDENYITIQMGELKYTLNDLENLYKNNPGILFQKDYINKNTKKIQYFLIYTINNEKLMFIPANNIKKIITNFGFTKFIYYNLLIKENFRLSKTGYLEITNSLASKNGEKTLHEVIHGKKAEKGGWKLIKENNPVFVDGKYLTDVKALWITMVSGRSIDKNDPNPQEASFMYYYDEINECNIKALRYSDESNWYNDNIERDEAPDALLGIPGDYYRDKSGNIYMKVDSHLLDHVNIIKLDNRPENIREITVAANNKNRKKKEDAKQSIFIGVKETRTSFLGSLFFRGDCYSRVFETEIDAAKFHDYHVFALYGLELSNNGTLKREEINKLLLYGVKAIPEKFLTKTEKKLPKNIMQNGDKFLVKKDFRGKVLINKKFDTLQEAIQALNSILIKYEEEKLLYKLEESKKRGDYINGDYGYLIIGEEIYKLNLDSFNIFRCVKWYYNIDGYPTGRYKKMARTLHIHVYIYFYPEYDKVKDGSIDHELRKKNDCTIEYLRSVTGAVQSQNVERPSSLGFQGIRTAGCNFFASYKKNSKAFFYLEDAMEYYNKCVREDPNVGENGKFHIIPEGNKRTAKDFYQKAVLTVEKLKNATSGEIYSIIKINKDWRKLFNVSNMDHIFKLNTLEYYREECIKLLEDGI